MKPSPTSRPVSPVSHQNSQPAAAPDVGPEPSHAAGNPEIPLFVPAQDPSTPRRRARSPLHQQLLTQAQAQRPRTQSPSNTETQSTGSASHNEQISVWQAPAAADLLDFFDELPTDDWSLASDISALENSAQNGSCIAGWHTWAGTFGAEPTEQRATALNRVMEWINLGDNDAELDLSSLNLSSRLPAFPQGLKKLDVNNNNEIEFTELPESLEELVASHNDMGVLPQLSHTRLRSLNLTESLISEIPELPITLISFEANGCFKLSSVPTLPPGLRYLSLRSVNNGHPIAISELPQNLNFLDISNSRFVNFPRLPDSLVEFVGSLLELSSLPNPLPTGLEDADFSENNINNLPSVLPASLTELNLNDNEFSSVPQSIFSSLTSECTVYFYSNPIPPAQWSRVLRITEQADYAGPRIEFDMDDGTRNAVGRALPDAVSDWYVPAEQAGVRQTWNELHTTEDAPATAAFSRFLDALARGCNARNSPATGPFSHAVRDLIHNMSVSPSLRADCFSISLEAITSCQDRATLYYEQMALPRLAEAVRQGEFANDAVLPDFCQRARALYRRSALTDIADRKVSSARRAVDAIEVHLAYQIRLNAPLGLGLDATMMAFETMAGLNANDFVQAEREVKAKENERFESYLVTQNGPWEVLFQQRNPDLFSRMLSAKNAVFEDPGVIEQAALERLRTGGSPINADSRREMERLVSNELVLQAQRPFVQQFMRECGHNPDQLLGPRWDLN